jgi:hypothetical protein
MGKLISFNDNKKSGAEKNNKEYDEIQERLNNIDVGAVMRILCQKEFDGNMDKTLLKARDYQKMIDCFDTMDEALSIIRSKNVNWKM